MKRNILFVLVSISIALVFSSAVFAEGRTIHGVAEIWEPYMGPDLKDQGFIPDLMKEIFNRAGYKTEVRYVPWARAVAMVKNGEVDVLLGSYYVEERTEFLEYPEEVGAVHVVLHSRKRRNITYKKLTDLKDYRIGVVRGAAHWKAFDKADYLQKEEVVNIEQNIEKLMRGRIDMMAGSKEVTHFIIKTKYPQHIDQIKIILPFLNSVKIYIAVSKKVSCYEELVKTINKGLNMIRQDGTYDKISMKHLGFPGRP